MNPTTRAVLLACLRWANNNLVELSGNYSGTLPKAVRDSMLNTLLSIQHTMEEVRNAK